jgi:hypothetical protein
LAGRRPHAIGLTISTKAKASLYAVAGYSRGVDPKEHLRQFRQLQDVRRQRDAAFAQAAVAHGLEKAKHLDEALSAMHKAFDAEYAKQLGFFRRIERGEKPRGRTNGRMI